MVLITPFTKRFVRQAPAAARLAKRASANRKTREFSTEAAAPSGGIGKRFKLTAEVTVSKLFPAGFGWQASSVWAEGQGMTDDSLSFFLTTGAGDAVAVFAGHTIFYSIMKHVYLPDVKIGNELQTGLWLGSAAFCSGSAWQPIVNVLSAAGLSFGPAALVTTGLCGCAFYFGLRMGRLIYGKGLGMSGIPANGYGNLLSDAQLSLSIGGAAGAFVGTDVSFADNWLRGLVGVEDSMSDVTGMVRAGTSTALGFAAFQSVQNIVWPRGRNWTD